ncbi:hypothetical protein EV178_001782 [Coemansia sp. RSA 1646]|nr:hypothetical protein EV178_001782 [Coemansia sp. RSA 1646]
MEEYELDDEMIEFYISLSATTNMSPMDAGVCFKTYTLDKEQYMRIVLQEEQLTISHGTTGLLTWEAGLFLSDFFVEHPDIIRDKNVIELGSGCGLAGFTCAAMGAANVLCTDVNGNVLHILEDNRKLNPSIVDKIQVADLDWEDTNECARLSKDVDVVIGSDILYDPTIVPLLVGALKTIVVSSQQVAYITAAFRNPDTFALFLLDDILSRESDG